MKITIQQIDAGPSQRILVMSDVHGHIDNLFQLLKKLDYRQDDILIIIGDLIEKGPDSLRTLRYIMEFSERENVYISMGNVDLHRHEILTDKSENADQNFLKHAEWVLDYWGGGLIPDMLSELGFDIRHLTEENAGEIRARLCAHFHREIDFLGSLPTILTLGKYIFVHGGIPTEDLSALAGMDAYPLLKNDAYFNKGYHFSDHIVVVGHWPTCLYRQGLDDLSPIFSKEQGITCIDGGCGVKKHGQLNALVIPGACAKMDDVSWDFCDVFPVVRAKEEQAERSGTIQIQYFDSEVEVLSPEKTDRSVMNTACQEETEPLLLLKHISSGQEFTAPVSFLWEHHGIKHCSDYCDEQLLIHPGDELHVLAYTEDGIFVKKNGRMGWYAGAYEGPETKLKRVPGAPAQIEAVRRERERNTYALLDRLGISYERIDHREARTMALCADIDEALDAVICKNLFLCNRQETRFYLLMMPGDKHFLTKDLSKQIGSSRLSFGSSRYMEEFLHIAPGSVSVMGLMNDTENRVQLLIDKDVLDGEYFGCHPCVNTSSIRMRMRDLLEVFLPAVGHTPVYVEL